MLGIKGVPIIFLQGESDDIVLGEISAEVNLYIEHEVSLYRQSSHLTDEATSLLLEALKAVENRTYLWVYLTFRYIREVAPRSREEIREATASLPETVNDAYEKILRQSRNVVKARRLLHIIVAAERPLTLAEMQVAMAIRETDNCYEDLTDRLLSDKAFRESINSICSLFITIFEDKIYLIHQTAKEFLVSIESIPCQKQGKYRADESGTISATWKASLKPGESHRILVEICLLHLLFNDIEIDCQKASGEIDYKLLGGGEVSAALHRHLQSHPFLAYSSRYWVHHFHQSDLNDERMLDSLMNVCDGSTARCQTWFRIFWTSIGTSFPCEFTTAMIASYFGLPNLAKAAFRKDSHELKHVDGTYNRSALSWAAENGCETVVKMLVTPLRMLTSRVPLLKRIDIDGKDIYGRTPLSYAAWKGFTTIAKRLVSAGASIHCHDKSWSTPLDYALYAENNDTWAALAEFSSDEVVPLSKPVLLLSAADRGNQSVVRWLLEQNTYIEFPNRIGLTPLWTAIEHEEYAVAEMLLEHGANINATIESSQNNLLYCLFLQSGSPGDVHASFLERLLTFGADINARDALGRTAVYTAVLRDNHVVLRRLLVKGAAADTRDNFGYDALSLSVAHGAITCMALLLEFGADTEGRNSEGGTPLAVATSQGHWKAVNLLIRYGADIEAAGLNAHSLLQTGYARGDVGLMAALLCRGVDPTLAGTQGISVVAVMVRSKDMLTLRKIIHWKGCTPGAVLIAQQVLWHAIENGDVAFVERLLRDFEYERNFVTLLFTPTNANGESALWLAVKHGYDRIVHLLLKYGAPADLINGSTARAALHLAARNGHIHVVRVLLKHQAKVDIVDSYGHTPLWEAVEQQHYDVANELLEHGARPDAYDV